MTQEQYIKILERELSKLNREIDLKIICGMNYSREATEHKIILRKMRQHRQKNFFKNIFTKFIHPSSFQF